MGIPSNPPSNLGDRWSRNSYDLSNDPSPYPLPGPPTRPLWKWPGRTSHSPRHVKRKARPSKSATPKGHPVFSYTSGKITVRTLSEGSPNTIRQRQILRVFQFISSLACPAAAGHRPAAEITASAYVKTNLDNQETTKSAPRFITIAAVSPRSKCSKPYETKHNQATRLFGFPLSLGITPNAGHD